MKILWIRPTSTSNARFSQFLDPSLITARILYYQHYILACKTSCSNYGYGGVLCGYSVSCSIVQAFSFLIDGPEEERKDLGKNLALALRVGEFNLKGLALLDSGHREKFGIPSPTNVRTTPVPGKVDTYVLDCNIDFAIVLLNRNKTIMLTTFCDLVSLEMGIILFFSAPLSD